MIAESSRRLRRWLVGAALAIAALWPATPQGQAPASPEAVRFAVIGDMGTGSRRQIETARRLAATRDRFRYTFVLTVGDNIYGGEKPADFTKKFEIPYQPLIEAGIPFYATLGNHDGDVQLTYPLFNLKGRRSYTFVQGPVQFFALDSTTPTGTQIMWLEDELRKSTSPWKIVYQHHPLYSSGRRHGPTERLQSLLEPLMLTFGVQVLFAGHEHFYERLIPQYGIYHFITGAGGQLRLNGLRRGSKETAAGYDQDNSFMLVAIEGNLMSFEAISRTGTTVDSGTVPRVPRLSP